jgi:hypothetical protein
MTAIGALIIAGLVITACQIAWQEITWKDPIKEMRHGKRTRR